MDKVLTVLKMIADAKSQIPGLRLAATLRIPGDMGFLTFTVDRDDPDFQGHLDEIATWEMAKPVDHRPGH